jgi:hypothetical protein
MMADDNGLHGEEEAGIEEPEPELLVGGLGSKVATHIEDDMEVVWH